MKESIKSHLEHRGVNLQKTKVVLDETTGFATFFLYNLSGELIGYQQYNPKGNKDLHQSKAIYKNALRYYTYVSGQKSEKKLAVWGLESYRKDDKYLFIVEGIFDAVKIHNSGYAAVAVLSNNPSQLKNWLTTLPQTIIVIGDNDGNGSGDKLLKFGNKYFTVPDPYKDLGEMSNGDAKAFIDDVISKI